MTRILSSPKVHGKTAMEASGEASGEASEKLPEKPRRSLQRSQPCRRLAVASCFQLQEVSSAAHTSQSGVVRKYSWHKP